MYFLNFGIYFGLDAGLKFGVCFLSRIGGPLLESKCEANGASSKFKGPTGSILEMPNMMLKTDSKMDSGRDRKFEPVY